MYSLETGLWIQVKYLNGIVWSREVHLKWLICKWSDFLGVWLAYVLESQVEACLQMDLREIWVGFCRCPFYLMQQIKGFLYPVWSSPTLFSLILTNLWGSQKTTEFILTLNYTQLLNRWVLKFCNWLHIILLWGVRLQRVEKMRGIFFSDFFRKIFKKHFFFPHYNYGLLYNIPNKKIDIYYCTVSKCRKKVSEVRWLQGGHSDIYTALFYSYLSLCGVAHPQSRMGQVQTAMNNQVLQRGSSGLTFLTRPGIGSGKIS